MVNLFIVHFYSYPGLLIEKVSFKSQTKFVLKLKWNMHPLFIHDITNDLCNKRKILRTCWQVHFCAQFIALFFQETTAVIVFKSIVRIPVYYNIARVYRTTLRFEILQSFMVGAYFSEVKSVPLGHGSTPLYTSLVNEKQ